MIISGYTGDKWEHLAWQWWEDHPEAKAELERMADEVAKDMNLRERLFGPDKGETHEK